MSTMLWLMRHGRATGQGSDAQLLPEGEEYVRALGRKLRGEGLRPVACFSSTYLRARDTAFIVLSELSDRPDVRHLRELTPDIDPAEAWEALLEQPLPEGDVLVVSHLPLVGLLCGTLTGDDPGFSPGTLVQVALDESKRKGRLLRVVRSADVTG
ncbi:MAG: histidine phosphatase family protein [Candidatus Eisenbacteria bacterium]|uniref:Histidine phosphatase family protein n=1 Tax=Eiseniibacteriota bacterium TaxID=2212470 RepID=A0A933SEV3_UNCEI|nr:histidine phosphatase family protein [Candidatus Eisenbacteria bacterium]